MWLTPSQVIRRSAHRRPIIPARFPSAKKLDEPTEESIHISRLEENPRFAIVNMVCSPANARPEDRWSRVLGLRQGVG